MAKSKSKKATAKKSAPGKKAKSSKAKSAALLGHNSNGSINKPLMQAINDYLKIDEDKKTMGRAQKDIVNRVKDEYNIDKEVFAMEIRMRKKAPERRAALEQGHADLKNAVGYQAVLPFMEGDEEGETNEGGEGQAPDPTDNAEEEAA